MNFGCVPRLLDITTLTYRWFGAIWREENGTKYVLGYWFADNKKELNTLVKQSGWEDIEEVKDKTAIQNIYNEIRLEQKKQDWVMLSRLDIRMMFKKQWRQMPKGYRILFSQLEFPFIATCVYKGKFFILIEHVCVCENEKDVEQFVTAINETHGIKLISRSVPQCIPL